jgi:hypothetical protein
LSLTTAVTRTGGVGDSFYVPLLSVLLTLVLVFELQKELIGSHSSWTIWLYAITCGVAWSWAAQRAYALRQSAGGVAISYEFRSLWTWLLTLLGIFVAVLGYLVPRTKAFQRRVTRARERLEERAAQSSDPDKK